MSMKNTNKNNNRIKRKKRKQLGFIQVDREREIERERKGTKKNRRGVENIFKSISCSLFITSSVSGFPHIACDVSQ